MTRPKKRQMAETARRAPTSPAARNITCHYCGHAKRHKGAESDLSGRSVLPAARELMYERKKMSAARGRWGPL